MNPAIKKCHKFYAPRIMEFKDCHKDEEIFLIASGPSLLKTPLYLIEDKLLFGVNQNFRLGLNFKYYGVSDAIVFNDWYKNIFAMRTILFLGGFASDTYCSDKDTFDAVKPRAKVLPLPFDSRKFIYRGWDNHDLSKVAYRSHTVALDVMLQVAYWMGCNPIVLVGWDFSWTGHKDHFYDDKFDLHGGASVTNLDTVPAAIRGCNTIREVADIEDRTIINCTVNGKLPTFQRKSLREVVER